MSLARLLYISKATKLLSEDELLAIHATCQAKNARRHVTGLLLYSSGNFMQLLEGPTFIVGELFDTICHDRRHTEVQRLVFETAKERLFPEWGMGMLNLDKQSELDRSRLASILQEIQQSGNATIGAKKALALLHEFRHQLPTVKDAA